MAAAAVPALVLAAGSGRRFAAAGGVGPKVLSVVDGRPLLEHVLSAAGAAGLSPAVIVVPDGLVLPISILEHQGRSGPPRVVVSARAASGIGASLSAGLEALTRDDPGARACVVLLADQPHVDPAVIGRVVDAWRSFGAPARARYLDGPGHPVLLPRDLWPALVAGPVTDEGARGMLAGLPVTEVDVATLAPRDVDRPVDLEKLDGCAP